jgi:hypothetical protein
MQHDNSVNLLQGGSIMRSICLISIAGLLLLAACSSTRRPSGANFTKAINQYLAKHGEACTMIVRQFPIDVPQSEQKEQYGIGLKLAALEQAGLVHSNDMTAVAHGMLEPLQGPTPPQPVKRYELTPEGKKYFQETPGPLGQTSAFCYGQKSVDSIVKWTEPATTGAYSQTEVTYTYRIVDPASWAERPEVQQVFSDIHTTIAGASKATEVAGLQLTNKGWEVPDQ